jgi:glyoxylase I family protein
MRVHHLAFRTDDLDGLERFYGGVLGLRVVQRTERSIWLDAGGSIVMLERRSADEPRVDPKSLELVAFDITAGTGASLETTLKAAGYLVESRTRCTLYVRDPDGRRIGLSSYPQML